MGIEEWIAEKKASGAIRQVGFSFHGAQGGFFELLEAYNWDFCQIQYNYMNETYQAGRAGLLAAAKKGLPVIVMEPLLGGRLASGVPQSGLKIFGDANPAYSPAVWTLRWLFSQPEVTVVLSGMNAEQQLEENIAAAQSAGPGCLSREESAAIEAVKSVFEAAYKIPCTGCNYCMPCPQNVNIPGCFAAYNASYANGFVTGLTQYITSTAANRGQNYTARHCVKCGKCERHCPQQIEITKALGAVARRMEPFWFGAAIRIINAVQSSEKPGAAN
jgi:predicted aldo/keto reductase-like oxidoreductase